MPAQHKSTKTIYKGREAYVKIDMQSLVETGEIKIISQPIIADETVTKVSRNGFEITYLAYMFNVFDKLGGQKYKVFKYIIQNKNSDNVLVITNKELAEKAKVSTMTVWSTIQLLKKEGLIATRTGAIMLIPKVAHRGNKTREAYLMQKFQSFENENNAIDDEIINSNSLNTETPHEEQLSLFDAPA